MNIARNRELRRSHSRWSDCWPDARRQPQTRIEPAREIILGFLVFQHDEGEQAVSRADDDILRAVEFEGHRAVADGAPEIGVPERLTGRGVEATRLLPCRR